MERMEQIEKISNERIPEPEKAFEALVITNLLETYQRDLQEVGFKREEVFEFLTIASEYEYQDLQKVLSLPYEIRKKNFNYLLEEYRKGKLDIKGVIQDIYNTSVENGFSLGYHTTPKKIKKFQNSRGVEVWNVEGTENDHRDGDLRMAYYSKDFENIYTQKTFENIYIVRAEDSHRNDTKWYRAPILPIIEEIEMNSVDLQKWFIEYQNHKEQSESELEKREQSTEQRKTA